MESKPAVAVVFHHIGPYHHARLNAAAARLSVTGFEWSTKEYGAWGADFSRARCRKVSLFPAASDRFTGSGQRHKGVIRAGAPFEFRVAKKWGSRQLELIYAVPFVKATAGFS